MRQGWEIKELGDVCLVIAGQSPEGKYYNNEINGLPFYQGKKEFNEKFIGPPTTWTTVITKEAIKDDILMSVRAPVGPVNFSTQKICIGRGLAAIRAGKQINKDFLFNFLVKHESEIIGNKGAVFNSINKAQIESIEIPLPPLPEQKRIVTILDEAFAAIAKAKANVEKNLQNANELFECYLQNVFADKVEDWEEKKLNEICEVKDGTHDSPQYVKDGIPFVTQKNIKLEGLSFADTKFISASDHNKFYKRSNVTYGDILISMIGANRGMAAIVNDKRIFSIKNVGLIKSNDKINKHYLLYYLKSTIAREYVKYMSNGGAQEFIGLTALRNFPIPYPKLREQNTIIEQLDNLSFQAKRLETIYHQKLNDLEELKKSILQKAFNGELTVNASQQIVSSTTAKVISLTPTDMQAGIITLALQKHNEAATAHTFGHVKSEKIVNTVQYMLELELDRNPQKDAAGPNDFKQLIKVESRAGKAGFFYVNKRKDRYEYTIGSKADSLLEKIETALGPKWDSLSAIVDLFVPMKTQEAEIVATVFAAWNNLLIDGRSATDEDIVYEAREAWHPSKLNIPRDSFFEAIGWMKESNLMPKGTGKKVIPKPTS